MTILTVGKQSGVTVDSTATPIHRPALTFITMPQARAALDRLLVIAKGDTGGAKLVADFLLN